MEHTPVEIPYEDLPELAETFADHVRLIHFDGQTVRVELAVSRPAISGPNQSTPTIYPACRLVLTTLCAANLKDQLTQILTALEKNGVIKRVEPGPTTRQ
jgi:hypothetical protein